MELNTKLIEIMTQYAVDGLLISNGYNVRYLSGFTGATGYLFITENRKVILTDFRYTIQAEKESNGYEVFEIDGSYEDSRHPKQVTFTEDLIEDLLRRDFTINAMAYNEKEGLIDVFEGVLDSEKKRIRAVGNPKERFKEDALRMMRALRFSAQLGYEIEENTKKAILEMAVDLKNISAERIQMELLKLITSPHPEILKEAYKLGVTKVFLPEFDKIMEKNKMGNAVLHAMQEVPENKIYRLAILFSEMGSAEANKICKRLKMDNATTKLVLRLVKYHSYQLDLDATSIRKAIYEIGEEAYSYLYQIKRAKIKAYSMVLEEEKKLDHANNIYKEIYKRGDCLSLKEMNLSGKDLLALGLKPGREVGELLSLLLEKVLEDPLKNTKEELENIAKRMIKNKGE